VFEKNNTLLAVAAAYLMANPHPHSPPSSPSFRFEILSPFFCGFIVAAAADGEVVVQ